MKPTDHIFLFRLCHRQLSQDELRQWRERLEEGNYEIKLDKLSYQVAKELLIKQRKSRSMS